MGFLFSKINTNTSRYLDELCLIRVFSILDPLAYELNGDFSMTPYGLVCLSNEILLNKRKNVIEFGSGLSTIFMGLTIRKYNLSTKITSVESDQKWVDKLNHKINDLNLDDVIKIIYAPIGTDVFACKNSSWYNSNRINSLIDKDVNFDMVVIDGPPAFRPEIELNRYGAIPYIAGFLSKDHVIFLDDANRRGEIKIMELWNNDLGFSFKMYNNRIAISRQGPFINSHPSFINNTWQNFSNAPESLI